MYIYIAHFAAATALCFLPDLDRLSIERRFISVGVGLGVFVIFFSIFHFPLVLLFMRLTYSLVALLATSHAISIWPFGGDDDDNSSSSSVSESSTESSSAEASSTSNAETSSSESSSSSSESESTTFGVPTTETSTGDGLAYAPRQTECPDFDIVRNASSLNEAEVEYVQQRQEITNEKLIDFLDDIAQIPDFDAKKFINDNKDTHNISIGLAFSGGGYRAMLCGAGELLALDDRYKDSKLRGLGGLLQSSTYLAGLSGGGWLLGTLVLNNWISVADILEPDSGIWDLEDLIFNPNGLNLVRNIRYYNALREALDKKDEFGFATSLTDVWGRALSLQFFNEDEVPRGGENLTWSGIKELGSYKNHSMPYPIMIANGRNPNTVIINENSTVYEISPNELGSWDPSLRSFVNIAYMGTKLEGGKPNTSECISHFDNAGFMMGTLSSLFNQGLLRLPGTDLNWALKRIIEMILNPLLKNEVDIAVHEPNPFYKTEYGDLEEILSDSSLHLVDGGEDQQNVPLYPLIQKSRKVDVIFGFDNSADTDENWPNGTSFVHTFHRQFAKQGKGTPFPFVPSTQDFLRGGLNERPVFFGCDAKNLSDLVAFHDDDYKTTDVPLVIYMPNSPHSHEANSSTYNMSYDDEEKLNHIQNGFEVSSRGNYTNDREWPTCVGCAIIRRQQERLDEEQSKECKRCFERYCWTGDIEDTPQLSIGSALSGAATRTTSGGTENTVDTSSTPTSSSTGSGSSDESTGSDSSSTSSEGGSNPVFVELGSLIVAALGALSIL